MLQEHRVPKIDDLNAVYLLLLLLVCSNHRMAYLQQELIGK
jgi:hypothetical protein